MGAMSVTMWLKAKQVWDSTREFIKRYALVFEKLKQSRLGRISGCRDYHTLLEKFQVEPEDDDAAESEEESDEFPCDDCDYVAASRKGLGQHRRFNHKKVYTVFCLFFSP